MDDETGTAGVRGGNDDEIIESTPVDPYEEALRTAFFAEEAKQSDRLDDLSKELFKIELAIPGIYIAAVAIAFGRETVVGGALPWVAYGFWLFGIIATVIAFFPRSYEVDPHAVLRTSGKPGKGPLTIREYYRRTARWKYWCNAVAVTFYLLGIIIALISLLQVRSPVPA